MWQSPASFQFRLACRGILALMLALPLTLPVGAQSAWAQDSVPAATRSADPAAAPAGEAGQAKPKPAKPKKPYGGGTPLDVLLHTKLWETPPEAKPFVKETREPDSTLHYQPTIGSDPARPKLLSKDQLQALQQELESGGARNEKAAGTKQKDFADVEPAPVSKPKPRKAKPKKFSADAPTNLHQP
ncbi:MAG: hypothetical protein ACLP8A_04815 [Methylovirgula sp.]